MLLMGYVRQRLRIDYWIKQHGSPGDLDKSDFSGVLGQESGRSRSPEREGSEKLETVKRTNSSKDFF